MENEQILDEEDIDLLFVTLKQINEHLETIKRIMVFQFGIIATMFAIGLFSAIVIGNQ